MTNAQQWNPTQRRKSIPRGRIERWLGVDRANQLSSYMNGWYGPPINVRDLPGSVWLDKHGEFVGDFERGQYFSADDAYEVFIRKSKRARQIAEHLLGADGLRLYAGAGFASISDALSRASQGNKQKPNGTIYKSGSTGVVGACNTLWRSAGTPTAGGAGSAAPGGRACSNATTGALGLVNPASGTMHLTGADFYASAALNSLLLYDRIFDVAKTMNSTATEAVTGVPTRYQSSTESNEDYAGGNFLFIEIFTALAATAHNWTTCLYRDAAGNDNQTLPSVTGLSGGIIDRFDMPINNWFCPLASGDVGIMDLAQMQCSAAIATGAINFVIGHPIGFMAFPVTPMMTPFDWLTSRDQAPRIFDSACLAFAEMPKPSTASTNYSGRVYITTAAP
jgi:hypothetical protein